jgi:hypothetical protein
MLHLWILNSNEAKRMAKNQTNNLPFEQSLKLKKHGSNEF